MEINRPNAQPLTSDDLNDLEKLKKLVERAVADGKLTQEEMNAIRAQVHADGKVLFEELELCRQLMAKKMQTGELSIEWQS